MAGEVLGAIRTGPSARLMIPSGTTPPPRTPS